MSSSENGTPAADVTAASTADACKWTTAMDPITNRKYYYHVETRQTCWTRPPDMAKGKSMQHLATSKGVLESSTTPGDNANHSFSRAESSNVLDKHDDPFAPRKGKALVWKNVNMTLVRIITLKHKDF
jgi:hypothetical protein